MELLNRYEEYSIFDQKSKESWYDELSQYTPDTLIMFLQSIGVEASAEPKIVKGIFVSDWGDEGELSSEAEINLYTHEVKILEVYDPADVDFEFNHLEREYVIIDNKEYPCCEKEDLPYQTGDSIF